MMVLKPPLQARGPLLNLYVPRAGDGCVLWLPGQDDPQSATIRDRSGQGNNGTIVGATWVRLPRGLWCLSFDGSDDVVTCAHDGSLNFTSEDFTIKAWIYCDNFTVENSIFQCGLWASKGYFFSITTTQRLDFYTIQAGATRQRTYGSTTVGTAQWQHAVATRAGAVAKLYLDAVDVRAVSGTHVNPATTTEDARIGLRDDDGYDMAGDIALLEVISGQAWTASQIANTFNRERHLFGV